MSILNMRYTASVAAFIAASNLFMYLSGKTLELEHPQYFVDGRGSLQAKKGR